MPTYDYHCLNCQKNLEVSQKITEDPLKTCPFCQSESLQRGPGGGIGLQFKGSGFYCTDYGSNHTESTPTSSKDGGGGCCPCGKSKNGCDS